MIFGMRGVQSKEASPGLGWLVVMQATNAVFCCTTIFGSIFILFLDRLGLDKKQIGLMLALLPLAGVISPFIAPIVGRAGHKRVYVTFWGVRKLVWCLVLAAPWVLTTYGPSAAFWLICGMVLAFALCRAIAETGWYPWNQEVVPDRIRGRFGAISNIVCTVAMAAALAVASRVVKAGSGMETFLAVFAAGTVFGIASVYCAGRIPGGRAVQMDHTSHWRGMGRSLEDGNFKRFLLGLALVILGTSPLSTFMPLFLKDQLGLSVGDVMLLDVASQAGGLASYYVWGYLADRRGSRVAAVGGLWLYATVVGGWMLAPRHSAASLPVAMAITAAAGVASSGYFIGSIRLLFVNIVPAEHKNQYMPVYYAWIGLIGAAGPLAAGVALDWLLHVNPAVFGWQMDPYLPMLLACAAMILAGLFTLRRVREARAPVVVTAPAEEPTVVEENPVP